MAGDILGAMFAARLICSDPDCAAQASAEAATLAELETLACECGCALEVIGWPDSVELEPGEVVELRVRRAGSGLPEAA